jgi:murein DD-endopeptidase MepM/ murein hydrolase activator NlpD
LRVALLLCLAFVGCGAAAEPDEIVLDADTPGVAAEKTEAERPPAGELSNGARGAGEERPPARVLRENAELRRDLEVLKGLEAERRKARRALAKLGAYDGRLQLGSGILGTPVAGPVVSPFGQRWGRLHAGIDIAAPAGRPIYAAEAGRVAISSPYGGYGNYLCIQHSREFVTCYAHLSRYIARRGDLVDRGQPVGLVGCTGRCFGDHLHFETYVRGRPVNPQPYL